MFDGQCFFFFSHSKSGTSNMNKAEDAGGTHPLSAVSCMRLFPPEAHCLIYECLPSTVRRRDRCAVSCPWPIAHGIGGSSALWRLSDRQGQKSEEKKELERSYSAMGWEETKEAEFLIPASQSLHR